MEGKLFFIFSKTNRCGSNTPSRGVLYSNLGNKTQYKLSDNENTTGENINYPEIPETRDNTNNAIYTTRNYSNLKPIPTKSKNEIPKKQASILHKLEDKNIKEVNK